MAEARGAAGLTGDVLPASAPREALVEAIERHQCELAIRWTSVQGGIVVDAPGLLRCINPGVNVSFANGVMRIRLEPEEVPEAVRESSAAFRRAGVAALWWITPLSRPLDVWPDLRAHGWRFEEEMPWMVASIEAVECPSPPAGLEIVRVTDESLHGAWLEGMTRGFGTNDAERNAMTKLATAVGYGEDGPWLRWAGFLQGHAVASSGLMLGGGVAGVYNVATAPEARRRGVGSAMTAEAVRAARERGFEVAVLGASTLGRGVYERMGFAEVLRDQVYVLGGP